MKPKFPEKLLSENWLFFISPRGVFVFCAFLRLPLNFKYHLDAPVKRVATYDVPIPFAPVMENFVVPSAQRIVEEARKLMNS